jgi:hypothetical protein
MEGVMKKLLLLLMVGIVLCFGSVQEVKSEQFLVHNGFVTGNAYFDLISKSDYLKGVIDGIMLAPLILKANKKQSMKWLETCLTGMTDKQLLAVVEKFMNENPIRWKENMHTLVYGSLNQSCPNSRYNRRNQ